MLDNVTDFTASLRTKAQAIGPGAVAVDPLFIEDPSVTKVVEYALKARKNILIVGPTGCGKSSLMVNICARLNEGMEIASLDGETSTDNLIAKMLITESNGQAVTSVSFGPALRAYRDGKILLLEEVDMANPDILASLHRIMETQSSFYTCNVGSGEVVKRHAKFGVAATANTIGSGEDSFIYAGTKPLNQAFMNRFSLTVRMNYLPEDLEVKVVVSKTDLPRDIAHKMVEVANEVRLAKKTSSNQQLVSTISTRDLIEWGQLVVGTGLPASEAAEYAFLNRINEADAQVIREFVRNKAC